MNMHQSRCEITDIQGFMEELLKVSLAEGFKVDLVTPNPAEILNCTFLRLVKCWDLVILHVPDNTADDWNKTSDL